MNTVLSYTNASVYSVNNNLLSRIQLSLRGKKSFSTISADSTCYQFFLVDRIREGEEQIKLTFVLNDKNQLTATTIEILNADTELNNLDLEFYLNKYLLDIVGNELNNTKKKYVIRNYCYYFNSTPIDCEIHINSFYRIKLDFLAANAKPEPLTQQILLVDTEVEAVSFEQAFSMSYNNTRDIISYLSVLLDVGFELLHSEYLVFLRKDDRGIYTERYRTAFLDKELNVYAKDNLNGIKSLDDKEDVSSFFSGKVSSSFVTDLSDIEKATQVVFDATKKSNLERIFEGHKIKKDPTRTADYREDIEDQGHFPNQEIKVPRCVRTYYRNIAQLEGDKLTYFTSFSRLYNLSLTMAKYEPTAMCAYRISAIEALAKIENISFSAFIRKYCEIDVDEDTLNFLYGNLRSGHFHSGQFIFNEYQVSMVSEFDGIFKKKRDLFVRFGCIVRSTIVNWINKEVLSSDF